jgi:hypothetical protein
MSQFTESQLATIKAAVAFLAETQQAHHSHVADDVQELLNVFNPPAVVVEEAPVVVAPVVEEVAVEEAVAEEVVVEETPAAE